MSGSDGRVMRAESLWDDVEKHMGTCRCKVPQRPRERLWPVRELKPQELREQERKKLMLTNGSCVIKQLVMASVSGRPCLELYMSIRIESDWG